MNVSEPGKLVVFSPLPPRQNGIADYSHELLAGLSKEFDCLVVVEDGSGTPMTPPGVRAISETEYNHQELSFASRLHIYQLGNNPDHGYILPHIQRCPGVAVLHDLTLHHLLDCVSVSAGDTTRYADALEAEYGLAGAIFGEQFRQFQLRENSLFFDMPMIGGIAWSSRGVIVHSKYGAVKVKARCPSAHVTVVPHQYSPPPPEQIEDSDDVRHDLGVGGSELLFMSLGFVTKAKRIDLAVRALAAVRDRLPPFKYVVAGELRPQEVDIVGLARSLGLGDRLVTPGYVHERRFFSLLQAADIVINLRHPVGGETSGTMIRALGAGACVVVVDRGPFAEIPLGASVPVSWGPAFDQRLAQALLLVGNDAALRRKIGQTAHAVTQAGNGLEVTVAGYKRAIASAESAKMQECITRQTWAFLPPHRRNQLVRAARQENASRDLPVWFSGSVVPICGKPSPRVVVIGAGDPEVALLGQFGYQNGAGCRFQADLDTMAESDKRAADLIICFADVTTTADTGARMLATLNERLAFGGILVLSVVRRSSAGSRTLLEQRQSGLRLLQSYGFRVDTTIGDGDLLLDDTAPSKEDTAIVEERCWRAHKVSEAFASAEFLTELLPSGSPPAGATQHV